MLWPLSIFGEAGVIAPAANPVTTTTVSPPEHCDAGEKAESVTLYEYVADMVGEAVWVERVAPAIDALHVPSEYH
jgi:hypothetical protein